MAKRIRKTMVESLRDEVEILTGQVAEYQAKADLWNDRLYAARQELDRAQNALAALEGTAPLASVASIKKSYPSVKIPDATAIRRDTGPKPAHEEILAESRPSAVGPKRVMFEGREIDLEPGMRVDKNSFGEDCLVPEGMPRLTPMEEPTAVRKPDFSLPAVGSADGFTSPEDLF